MVLAQTPARIPGAVIDAQYVRLRGGVLPQAVPANDRGPAPADLPMRHMLLVLRRNGVQELDLRQELAAQRQTGSSEFHHWLSPREFGARFGPAPDDVATVTAWLRRSGFQVDRVSQGRGVIEFSGTALQVETALHAPIHRFRIQGALHWANAANPTIPAALQPLIAGVVSLNDVRKPAGRIVAHGHVRALAAGEQVPLLNAVTSDGTILHALAPGDFYNIYSVSPAYNQNLNGSGVTIGIVARTEINLSDDSDFRSLFFHNNANLPHMVILDPGSGNQLDLGEATLDAEWAGAVAQQAQIDLVVSGGTSATDGVDLSAEYIVDNDLAPVMSTSFGFCEALMSPAEQSFWNSLWEQAAAEGISAFVAAGDNGAAGCDAPEAAAASHGLGVSALASTPFDTAVGGNQFNDTANPESYWLATTSADQNYVSAMGYIPEQPWNESALQFNGGPSLWSGSGGVSSLYAKPGWQTGTGVPADGHRDIPDVALTAAEHDGYVVCIDSSCNGAPYNWSFGIAAGTSAASPSMAGIMALIVQKMGGPQGLVNPYLYQLASKQDQTSLAACAASGPPAAECVFNDVTTGNNFVPCVSGSPDCARGSLGYTAGPGYDLATGLGSVNVGPLVAAWGTVKFLGSQVSLDVPATFTFGQNLPVSVQVAPAPGGSATPPALSGDVELLAEQGSTVTPLGLLHLVNGSASTTTAAFPAGTYTVVARYGGDVNFSSALSVPASLTVAKISTALQLQLFEGSQTGNMPLVSGSTIGFGGAVFARVQVTAASGTPTGTVGLTLSAGPPLTLDASGGATTALPLQLTGGTDTITATYAGDADHMAAPAVTFTLQVTKATTSLIITASDPVRGALLATLQTSAAQGTPPTGFLSSNQATFSGFGNSFVDPVSGDLDFVLDGTLLNASGTSAIVNVSYPGDANYAASAAAPLTMPTPPKLTPGATSLTFPTTTVGARSAPQALTLTNTGGTALPHPVFLFTTSQFLETDNCGPSLGAGSSCQVAVVFAPAFPGTTSAILDLEAPLFDPLISLSGVASGFELQSGQLPPLPAGKSASVALTIQPVAGFAGTVGFSCSSLPPLSTCSFSPATVTLDGSAAVTTTLTVNTSGNGTLVSQFGPLLWLDCGVGLFLFVIIVMPKRQRRSRWRMAATTLLAGFAFACGGGGGATSGGDSLGTGANPPPYSVSPAAIGFGTVPVGTQSQIITVQVSNGGLSWPAPTIGVVQSGLTTPDFTESNNCSGTMSPETGCNIQVRFKPSQQQTEQATLELDGGRWVTVPLTGSGSAPQTPPGEYFFSVTGTSGTATASTNVVLNVQ